MVDDTAGNAPGGRFGRWPEAQVAALARRPAHVVAAAAIVGPARWSGLGCDARAVWGRFSGSSAEPYETMVDHREVAMRCSCPARLAPCKHALALLLMWSRGLVADAPSAPHAVSVWLAGLRPAAEAAVAPVPSPPSPPSPPSASPAPAAPVTPPVPTSADRPDHSPVRDERIARTRAGLAELSRWLEDRMRTGLADPAMARFSTWDDLAARLVDARAGALANRVRRIAGLVGSGDDWHARVLAEIGVLHLLAEGGQRMGELDPATADALALAVGWQVRQADVLAGVPDSDTWMVMGRSDTREDRIEVRRLWLLGQATGRWAMVLSFAAFQQSLDDSWPVGSCVATDLFRYPGAVALRALMAPATPHPDPPVVADAAAWPAPTTRGSLCAVGAMLAAEPWLERAPVLVRGTPTRAAGRWWITDRDGAIVLAVHDSRPADPGPLASLAACSGGQALTLTAEWTPDGLVPLTIHLPGRHVDIGPRADPSFVRAA